MAEEETLPVEVTPRIVEGVFASGNVGGMKKSPLAMLIQTAMSEAVQAAYGEGIHDPEVIRERMQEARRKAKDLFAEATRRAMEEVTGSP